MLKGGVMIEGGVMLKGGVMIEGGVMLKLRPLLVAIGVAGCVLGARPARAADQPVLIDTIGQLDSEVRVWAYNTRPPSWVPDVRVFVKFQAHSSDDILMVQLKKGGRAVGKPFNCQSKGNFIKDQTPRGKPARPVGIADLACKPGEEAGQTADGAYTVSLSYKQTLAGKEFKDFASLQLKVMTLLQGNQDKPYKNYFEDGDMRLGPATISEHSGFASDSNVFKALDQATMRAEFVSNQMTIPPGAVVRVWLKSGGTWLNTKLTCLHNGKKVAEASNNGSMTRAYWTYPRARKPQVKFQWEKHQFELKDLKFDPPSGFDAYKKSNSSMNLFWLSKNPGEYRCVLTADGDILKELYFTVGPDGKLVQPACQAKMTTLRQVALMTTKDLKAPVPYDKKAGQTHGFSGHVAWSAGCPPVKK